LFENDPNDVFEKLRRAVATSGSGLPIHVPFTPEKEEPDPIPRDDDIPTEIDLLQGRVNATLRQRGAYQETAAPTAEPSLDQAADRPEGDAFMFQSGSDSGGDTQGGYDFSGGGGDEVELSSLAGKRLTGSLLGRTVIDPVLPRELHTFDYRQDDRDPRYIIKLTAAIVILGVGLVSLGGVAARKAHWGGMGAVHITDGDATPQAMVMKSSTAPTRWLQPAPKDGPTPENIQDAAEAAVTAHYAALSIAGDRQAVLTGLRIAARQPSDQPGSWRILMGVETSLVSRASKGKRPELKKGFPSEGSDKIAELTPEDMPPYAPPPPVLTISGPMPKPTKAMITRMNATDGKIVPVSGEPAGLRWVTINWSGERWFIGDYEFD